MFESLSEEASAKIVVIGVGGGGGNAVNSMMLKNIKGVEFIVVNTDSQALKDSQVENKFQIGSLRTKGLGCGAVPLVGYESAMESRDEIKSHLEGADMLFITAGMGGGTGTGASPVIAGIAKELGILTVGVVTKPFSFEGKKKAHAAEQGIMALKQSVDSIIIIENTKLLEAMPKTTSLLKAFERVNEVLSDAVFSIAKIITSNGLVNVDFADVSTVMRCTGRALMGAGEGDGENRAVEATAMAIECPLLEDFDMRQAKGVLCTISHGVDFQIGELEAVGQEIHKLASDDATVVIGTIFESEYEDRVVVTVIATGIDAKDEQDKIEKFVQDQSIGHVESAGSGVKVYSDKQTVIGTKSVDIKENVEVRDSQKSYLNERPDFLLKKSC
jgi:cell division protein FtsZ